MFFAIALLSGALALQQGEATVRGELSSHATRVGEPVVLTISVRTRSAEDPLVQMPSLPAGLTIAGTSSSTSLEISMPGGRTNTLRFEYEIIATRPGQYTILPATVKIGKAVYRTERLDLSVGGSPNPSRANESPITLRASVEPKTPYVGQQVLLRLDAVIPTDSRFRPVRPPSYDPPSPSGFWIQDLPDPITSELRIGNGTQYEVQTYSRAYFPLTPGTFTIPAARIIYDLRGGVFFAPETREVLADSLLVTVKPLPEEGRPASFHGAVGSFTVSGGLDRGKSGTAGDALTYTLVVEGTGNIKSLPAPAFPTIPNVDVYPPSEDAVLRVVNGRVGGARTFQWVLVPRRSGQLTIPPVEYAWFDPATAKYATASTQPVSIPVSAANAIATAGGDTTLAPLRRTPSSGAASFVRSRAFLALQLVPVLLVAAALLIRRRRHGPSASARSRRAEIDTRLTALGALAQTDARAFYTNAIRLVEESCRGRTDRRNACDELIAHMRAALYAPEGAPHAQRIHDLDRVTALVRDMQPTGRKASGAAATVIVLVALAIPCRSVAAQQSSGTDFDRGVASYASGDFAGAAAAFARHAAAVPDDAAAWYDMGNAYYRAGDHGRAVWSWIHALELEPRNADVAHNIRLLNASRAAAAVQRWFPISSAELAILACACWWLSLILAGLHLIRPRAGVRLASLLLGTACATALIMLAARWAGPGAVVPLGRGATLYAAPTARTEVRGRLEVGDAAEVLRREGDWLLVRASDFSEGWVTTSAVGEL